MKKNRTETTILVYWPCDFMPGGQARDYVYVPFDIMIESFVEYCSNKGVIIDGKDNDIWNLFNPMSCTDWGFFDDLADNNEEFKNIITDKYNNSKYKEEDYQQWLEDMEIT